ncbi:MAG: hypothetical protein A4E71_00107 [Smithella sp. PtaU1.Bin162]|nr:MAG: hypothetical protein A4E71_00107 [Smithella sp. PtaU1.Bin162]
MNFYTASNFSMIITDPQRINEFIEWLKKNRIQADPRLMRAQIYPWTIIFSSTEHPSSDLKDRHVDYLYITIFGFIDKKDGRIIDGSNAENYEIVERRVKEIRDFFKKYGKPFSEYNNKIFDDNESDKNYESRL